MIPGLIALALLIVATVFDLRTREVPDTISVILMCWAVAVIAFRRDGVGWRAQLAGFCVGLLVSGLFFALNGLGGADVKLIAALGAVLGHPAIWAVLFWVALAGAGLSLIALARGQRDLAYVPAISLGLLIHLFCQIRNEYGWH